MKKVLLLFMALSLPLLNTMASNLPDKKVESKIEQVTVFLNSAQVERSGRTNLNNGKTELIFENISRNMNPESLQVGCKGPVTIIDVRSEMYNEEIPKVEFPAAAQSQIDQLNKEITNLNSEIWYLEVERKLLQKEKSILETNPLLSGKTDSLALLKEGMSFLHQKTLEIAQKEMQLTKKLGEFNGQVQAKREKINQITVDNTENKTPSTVGQHYKVIVTVNADGATNSEIDLTYLVSDARWIPAYDIRTEGVDQPLKLAYKSRIYQNTGVDWNEVDLVVSTGNPTRKTNRPVLNPWQVQLYNAPTYNRATTANGAINLESLTLNSYAETNEESIGNLDMNADLAGTQINDLNVSYELTIAHSIPSDRKWHMVQLKETDVEAEYEHHSVPKLAQSAYLLAKVKNWGALNLLAGQANLFMDGTYVGQTQINPQLISEELLLSLGVDEGVGIKRYKLDSECNTAFISGKKTQTFTWEIMLHNKKGQPVGLSLLDQFPLAHQSEIEIELVNEGGAEVTAEYGKLLWDLELAPNEIRKVQFTYSVKHPKDKLVTGI